MTATPRSRGTARSTTVAQAQRKDYTDIHTIQILTPPAKLYARALKAAKAMGWNIVAARCQ